MLDFLLTCLLWYLIGISAMLNHYIILNFIKKEEITLTYDDVVQFFGFSMLGPILYTVPIFKKLFEILENYGNVRNKVIWENRRAKNRRIIYGDPNND